MNELDKLRCQCWDIAFHVFGTASIFEHRVRRFRIQLRVLSFFGIAVPVLVGGIIMTYGTQYKYVGLVLSLAGILSLIQLVATVWALIDKWDDTYAYAQESTSSNYDLSNKYKVLAQNPPADLDNFKRSLELLDSENQRRSDSDYRQSITDAEKRMGMRAALRNFGRTCAACHQIPASMKPTRCDVCGNF